MSLRTKILWFVAAVSLAFVTATWLTQQAIMLPEFARLEQRKADEDLKRCVQAIERDLELLSRLAREWAAWDDTYVYAADLNEDFERNNLRIDTFDNLDIDVLALLRTDGSPLWSQRLANQRELAPTTELLEAITRASVQLLGGAAPGSTRYGIVSTPRGPLLVGASIITNSERTAPSRGTLLMGRFLSEEMIEGLAERTGVALALHSVDAVPAPDRPALAQLATGGAVWRSAEDPKLLRSYTLLSDSAGDPVLLLRSDLPRIVTARAHQAANWAALTSVGAGVLMSLITWWVLARMIVAPLSRVTRHAVRAGAEGDLRTRLDMPGRDEIAILAREFDEMLGRLAASQAQLVGVAQSAGRAEIATNVLHNVGNVLNSANVSAGVISRTIARSEVHALGQAVDLMQQRRDDLGEFLGRDERGRHLPDFLTELSAQLRSDHETLQNEVKVLSVSIEHIRQIVQAQNEYSRAKPLVEPTDAGSIVDQALVLTSDSFVRHRIHVERKVEDVGIVPLDRHRVLQILTNLLANAKHAVKQGGCQKPRITIGMARVATPAGERLRLRVEDNGVGIPPENLQQIFAFGFSTRPDGQGVGLHGAVNQAREMGGDLTAESAGPGLGAAFTLTLPIAGARNPV